MRQVRALIRALPRESALWREIAPQTAQWTTTEELLAALIEMTDAGWRLFAKANGAKSVGPPLEIPRPDDAPKPEPERRRGKAGGFLDFLRSLPGPRG